MSGAKGDDAAKPAELFPDSLIWAIVTVFVVGLGSIIGMMAVMKNYNFNDGMIGICTLISFALMIVVEAVFVWLLLSRKREMKESLAAARPHGQATKELDAAHARALPEHAPSVTEHTTRTFDPVYNERKSK